MLPIVEKLQGVKFWVEERKNPDRRSGKEWALYIRFVGWEGRGSWCMATWEKKPTDQQVEDTKYIVKRAMEVYHRHFTIPYFNLEEVE